jgi:pimeloyl-ACP methyl ester carboxylesterase
MRNILRYAVVAAFYCTACSLPSQQRPVPLDENSPAIPRRQFFSTSCAFDVPSGAQVQCGWLTVLEDRTRAGGRTIRLHVAIYKSRAAPSAPDPILWLVGGPGGRANVFASKLFDRVVQPYLARRDFIVLDIRGSGYSQPALDCPNPTGPAAQWMRACRERLRSVADLDCYNSAAVAADLDELRRALGVREWNLLGESYGTRYALVAMRDHPEGIRSVVLDSVVPPEVDEYADGPAKFESAVSALFSDCAADPGCKASYPDPRSALLKAADRLDRSPRHLAGVWHGTPFEVRFDGRQLIEALHMALYESDVIPRIPWALCHAADGRADGFWSEVIARHVVFVARTLVDLGAELSFHCAEEVPFTDVARLKIEDERRPWMRHTASGIQGVETCRLWNVKPAGHREALPVHSDIPTLLLAGSYDPVTPPAYARSARSHLPNGHLFVFPAMGHQLTANSVSACPQTVVLQFLDDPKQRPDPACLGQWRPHWELR